MVVLALGLLFSLSLAGCFSEVDAGGEDAASSTGPEEVTIVHAEPFDQAEDYAYVEAVMSGTVERDDGSEGEYEVPLVLIYPHDGGNSVGVVDIPNSVFYPESGFIPDPMGTLQLTRQTTDGFLFEQGYTYASVQWNKEVTDLFADDPGAAEENHLSSGSIERTDDAWQILRDTADFLRDPTAYIAGNDAVPDQVDTVLSSGYSQSGTVLQKFVLEGENQGAYDGHLIGTGGNNCWAPEFDDSDEPAPLWVPGICDAEHEGEAKVISIITEATVGWAGAPRFENGEPANWRQYELAGVAHTNPAITPDEHLISSEDRNPVVHIPVFRAAFHNLALWASEGIEPPPSLLLEGEFLGIEHFPEMFEPVVDEDGNALGGLRLPHMEQTVNGQPAGAPLGTYTGLNSVFVDDWLAPPSIESFAGIITHIAGTLTPFDEAELQERYPNQGAYVNRVARAADQLLAEGYILEADKDEYVRDAAQSDVGRRGLGN